MGDPVATSALKWFIAGFVLSSLIAGYVIHKWLEGFAFRIDFGRWVYLTGAILVLLINFIAVSFQSWKASI